MDNNIFFRQKKDKYNPDIETKLNQKDSERTNTNFNMTNTIYNPITNIVPAKISSSNDLILERDNCLTKIDIDKLIMKKSEERSSQDINFKPTKTKITNESSINNISTPINNMTNNISTPNNYIATHNELKQPQNIIRKQVIANENQQKIIQGLKDLGIFK